MEKTDQNVISNGRTGVDTFSISSFDYEMHYILPCWTNAILLVRSNKD